LHVEFFYVILLDADRGKAKELLLVKKRGNTKQQKWKYMGM